MINTEFESKRVFLTTTCSFKLYTSVEESRLSGRLRALSIAWIYEATAGFILLDTSARILNAFWWERNHLFRAGITIDNVPARGSCDPLSFSSLEDLPVIAYEADSWARHVVQTNQPSMPAYLGDLMT